MDAEPKADEVPEMDDHVVIEDPVVEAVPAQWDMQSVLSCLQGNMVYVAAVVAVLLILMIVLCCVCYSKKAMKKKKE